ncbi:hypothetical protein [Streptomyces sp. NPDC055287]
MIGRAERPNKVSKEMIEDALDALGASIRPELARLGALPDGLAEAVLQMLPFGTRTALEVLGLVEAEPKTSHGVRILRLRALGKAVLKRLAAEESDSDLASIPIKDLLEVEPVQWSETSEQDYPPAGESSGLIPVSVRLEGYDEQAEKMPSPVVAAVEVGQGAATVAHLAVEVVSSMVRVWQTSGRVDVIDARTRQPLPQEGEPLEISEVEESADTADVLAARLAVDLGEIVGSGETPERV